MVRLSKKKINVFLAVIVSLAILMTSFVSFFIAAGNKAKAAGDITIYFDTSNTGSGSGFGWSKTMSKVYYHAYKSGGSSTGLTEMTATGLDGKDGGKLFKASVNPSQYSEIIFSSKSSWGSGTDRRSQTKNYGLSGTADNSIFILNGDSYTVNSSSSGSYKAQGMYVYGTYKEEEIENFAGQSFSILNMSDAQVSLKLVFSDATRTKASTVSKTMPDSGSYDIPARYYWYNEFSVPDSGNSKKPYSAVEIQKADGTSLKTYYFSEGKILGRTFEYGVSQLTNPSPQVISYQSANPKTAYTLDEILYLDKKSITDAGAVVKGVNTTTVNKDGNALYKTVSAVNNQAFTPPTGTNAQKIDLSAQIFSISYNGNTYNLFGPENQGDNLVILNDDVMTVSGKFTTQSTDNVLKENGKEYPYITVQSDMYDYQYDKFNHGYYNSDQFKPEGWNSGSWPKSEDGNAKRPYMAINEAISKSAYAQSSSNYPLYLGQFWLPLTDGFGGGFSTSAGAYTNATAAYQRAAHNSDGDAYLDNNNSSEYYKYFGFGERLKNFDWSANLAFRYSGQEAGTYEPYNGVVQGLVHNKLINDKLYAKDGVNTLPYFDLDWWNDPSRQNFEITQKKGDNSGKEKVNLSDYIKTYDNLDFPFFETNYDKIKFKNYTHNGHLISNTARDYKGTYYVFNSEINAVKVNTDYTTGSSTLEKHYNDDNYKVWDNYGEGTSNNGSEIGFFPFNSKSDGGHDSQKLHYGFGVRFSIDFYLTENGTVNGVPANEGGIPITFTFQGDDDVWVFLDDTLLLDMGGGHKNSIGEINFADRTVFIGSAGQAGGSVAVSSAMPSRTQSFGTSGSDITVDASLLATGKHKITMFYMERGMLNSNLYVMFNLPMSLTRLELQEDTDFTSVNNGFLNAARAAADTDVFNYQIENKGTTDVVGSSYQVPSTGSVVRNNPDNGTGTNSIDTTELGGGSGEKHTYDFKCNPNNTDTYYPLMSSDTNGVSYQLSDPFASDPVFYDSRTIGNTKGVVSMQYGEMITLNKQFNYGSSMMVTQLDALSAPDGSRTSYADDTGRRVSDYYVTYMKSTDDENAKRGLYAGIYNGDDLGLTDLDHVETMYGDGGAIKPDNPNYSMNSIINLQEENPDASQNLSVKYNFNDPTNAANEYVHLRQVVVNSVKTYDLTFRKMMANGDPQGNEDFTFKIEFSNVLGKSVGNGMISYSDITFNRYAFKPSDGSWSDPVSNSLSADGTFTLKAYDYIVISGIPAGTQYSISEQRSAAYVSEYTLDNASSKDMDGSMFSDVEAIATNKRKTGVVEVTKTVVDADGLEQQVDDMFAFTFRITEIPANIDISKYQLGYRVTDANGTTVEPFTEEEIEELKTGKEFPINRNMTYLFTGIPYGVKYEVTETNDRGYCVSYSFSDENKVIDDTREALEDGSDPIDSVEITNIRTFLDIEKKVVINQWNDTATNNENAVNPEIFAKIDDNWVKNEQFNITLNHRPNADDVWAAASGKAYIEGGTDPQDYDDTQTAQPGTDGSTGNNGTFSLQNDYDKEGRQQNDAPHKTYFVNQFRLGEQVQISEEDAARYNTTYQYTNRFNGNTVPRDITDDPEFTVQGRDSILIENTLKTANLTIVKSLDEAPDADKTFTFTVTLEDVGGEDACGMTGGDPVKITKTVTVAKDTDSANVVIEGIPVGTKYAIDESDSADTGYVFDDTQSYDMTGTINDEGAVATVQNNKRVFVHVDMPETGAVPFVVSFTAIGIAVIGIAASAMLIYRKKLKKAVIHTNDKGRYADKK